MKTLSSQYAEFTSEERLRLFLAAAERGDRPEVQRLLRTCPQMSLVGADPQFSTRAHWMQAAVSQVMSQLLEASGYVLATALLDGAPRKGRAAKPKGRATWKGRSTIWRGIDAGITKFCAETGLTVEQLFVLAGGRSPLVEGARGVLHPDAPADRGCENGICRLLRQAWQGGNE
jgi:hypothetical protein